ncbi:MAG: CvpA family protein [Neisseriales bacterium]|nr:MAG: CvpA family protein [Neisseriales bacterium]
MEIFDLIVVIIMGASITLSLFRGLVSEILSLAAWFITFFVAKSATPTIATIIPTIVTDIAGARTAIAFVVVFIFVWILTVLCRILLSKLIKASGLSGINRILGVLFGALRGIALVACMTLICGLTNIPKKPSWQKAFFTAPFEKVVRKAAIFLPNRIVRQIHYPPRSSDIFSHYFS